MAAVEDALNAELARINAARFTISECIEEPYRQEKRGCPGADTRFRKTLRGHRRMSFEVDAAQIAHDAASDDMRPVIASDRTLTDAELLAAYKFWPGLDQTPGKTQENHVAPAWLHDPARIEGLLAREFIALPISALIESALRQAMQQRRIPNLSICPEDHTLTAPTIARIIGLFERVSRHHLTAAAWPAPPTTSVPLLPTHTADLDSDRAQPPEIEAKLPGCQDHSTRRPIRTLTQYRAPGSRPFGRLCWRRVRGPDSVSENSSTRSLATAQSTWRSMPYAAREPASSWCFRATMSGTV